MTFDSRLRARLSFGMLHEEDLVFANLQISSVLETSNGVMIVHSTGAERRARPGIRVICP